MLRVPVRPNYRGDPIPAAAGVFFIPPALLLALSAAVLMPAHRHALLPVAAGVAAFAALGLLDDLWGSREFGGIRGHVRALLRHGRLTTGLVKMAGGGLAGVAIGWWIAPRPGEALLNGAVIALAANLVNLLDLRPGRALKAFAFGALVLAGAGGWASWPALFVVALPAALYAPFDLRARAMMGDTGANALGAALGVTAALHLGFAGRIGVLAVLAGLHVLSEFVSFSAAIERSHVLRWVDRLGRR